MKNVLWFLIAYLMGSIPWGLVIGKFFFQKDIREYGSHNLGGTNAARVLGLPYGICVMILDALKSFLIMAIGIRYVPEIVAYLGLIVCFGHCFPIFANFKGGKAVSCAYGYYLGLAIYVCHSATILLVPAILFFIVLFSFKMVSLASMVSTSTIALIMVFLDSSIGILLLILALFILYRHRANINRIYHHTESKIKI